MPPTHPNTESRHGLPPIYPVESVCWSCGGTVQGDPTAAMRRCPDCEVTWMDELLPARQRRAAIAAEQGSQTTYGHANRPWNQFIRALARPLRDGD